MKLVSELQCTGHEISKGEVKRALLKGWLKEFYIPAESFISVTMSYSEPVLKLIIRETRLDGTEVENENACLDKHERPQHSTTLVAGRDT